MLANSELERRVALLKKLKETLHQQREKFSTYLKVLDQEQTSVQEGRLEALQEQVKIEETLVAEIGTFQKVLDPLEAVWKQTNPEAEDAEVVELKQNLAALKVQVQEKNAKNRSLLSAKMEEVRSELLKLRPRPKNPYGSASSTARMIDIST